MSAQSEICVKHKPETNLKAATQFSGRLALELSEGFLEGLCAVHGNAAGRRAVPLLQLPNLGAEVRSLVCKVHEPRGSQQEREGALQEFGAVLQVCVERRPMPLDELLCRTRPARGGPCFLSFSSTVRCSYYY